MSPDEWQAQVTRVAAQEIGTWLEARGRLDRPIASLQRSDLETMATLAIGRFIALAAHRIRDAPGQYADLEDLLMG